MFTWFYRQQVRFSLRSKSYIHVLLFVWRVNKLKESEKITMHILYRLLLIHPLLIHTNTWRFLWRFSEIAAIGDLIGDKLEVCELYKYPCFFLSFIFVYDAHMRENEQCSILFCLSSYFLFYEHIAREDGRKKKEHDIHGQFYPYCFLAVFSVSKSTRTKLCRVQNGLIHRSSIIFFQKKTVATLKP